MRIIRSIRRLQTWRRQQDSHREKIGFVPTMGALHAGHLSLIHRARKHCDRVVVSIFVNPLQFGPREDLGRYPRSFHADQQLCQDAGVDLLFVPSRQDMYPQDFQTRVIVSRLTQRWEGQARPTHFEGVTTVVTKLLYVVGPHLAYFGQKDYQQLLVVKQLVQDLHMKVKIVRCPTVRESDGLALSSRNQYLQGTQRTQARLLVAALRHGRDAINGGQRNGRILQATMNKIFAKQPEVIMEYLAVCDPCTLEPLTRVQGTVILLGAIRLGEIRLIDNLLVVSPKGA